MKKLFTFSGWILAVIFAPMYFVENSNSHKAESKADTLRHTLAITLPKIVAANKATTDSNINRNIRDERSRAQLKQPPDTGSNILTKIDTVNNNLRRLLAANKKDFEAIISKKNDSLQSERTSYRSSIAALKRASQNIVFKSYPATASAMLPDTDNAAIYAKPFKRSRSQSLFSPQINYLRIYNQNPHGTVNGMAFYDYEQTNDEINQLLFQVRSAYNLSGKFQFGGGAELKINRTAVSGAMFFNPFTKQQPSFSLGFRQDVYRIKF